MTCSLREISLHSSAMMAKKLAEVNPFLISSRVADAIISTISFWMSGGVMIMSSMEPIAVT